MIHNEKAGVAAFVIVRQIRFDLQALLLQVDDMSSPQQACFAKALRAFEAAILQLEVSCTHEEDIRCRRRDQAGNN